jgi:ABC-type lipoprotein release transport system permease subunit
LLALALTRYLEGWLYDVSPYDPLTFVAIGALLATVAILACSIPAHRATRIAPSAALRQG